MKAETALWLALSLAGCAHGAPAGSEAKETSGAQARPPRHAHTHGDEPERQASLGAVTEASGKEQVAAQAAPPAPAGKPAPAPGRVTVLMRGFEHARGQVLVALWRHARGFPEQGDRAFRKAVTRVRKGEARVVFDQVPRGAFAVAVHHDADGDFEMDTGLLGIPAEGYGFSRDARGSFGPPDYADARLWLRAGEHKTLRIRISN